MERELEVDHEFIVNRALKSGNIHTWDAFTNSNGVDTGNPSIPIHTLNPTRHTINNKPGDIQWTGP